MQKTIIIEKESKISMDEWKEKIGSFIIDNLLNKHVYLITVQPVKWSYGYEFENKYKIKIQKKKCLITEIQIVDKKIAFEISTIEEFYRDSLFEIFYDFDESKVDDQMIKEAVTFFLNFDFVQTENFNKGKLLFTINDGEILINC